MRRLYSELSWFLKQKLFWLPLSLAALMAYGFEIVNPIIGIDDTAVGLYLEDGLEVVMGRWTVFLLNKLFHLSDFAPFLLELAGVLLLMAAATLFCVWLKRIFGDSVPTFGYSVFACLFVTQPIISEVYIYYYHDGVGVGYCLTAAALLLYMEAMEASGGQRVKKLLLSLVAVWAAVGCYESFLILYIVGLLSLLFLRGAVGSREKLCLKSVTRWLAIGAVLSLCCVLLRSMMIQLMTAVFGLQGVLGLKPQRSILEMSWMTQGREGFEYLKMLIKRYWLVYHVNAIVYFPIAVYEAAVWILGLLSVCLAVKKRNIWFPLLFLGMNIAPFLLTLAEGDVTKYRSCQYIPFFTGLAAFCLCAAVQKWLRHGAVRYVAAALTAALVFNQAFFLSQSFYEDYLKYEDTRKTLLQVASVIEQRYGKMTPVIFTGHYETPEAFRERYYVGLDSREFERIARVTDPIDEHLKEKYYTDYGYSFVGEAQYPFILWAVDAFDGTNGEMLKFLEMHGHSFEGVTDAEVLEQARQAGDTMPKWPKEGSVALWNGYVLVHF